MTWSYQKYAMAFLASRSTTFEHYEPPVPSVAAAEWYRLNWKTERWVVGQLLEDHCGESLRMRVAGKTGFLPMIKNHTSIKLVPFPVSITWC